MHLCTPRGGGSVGLKAHVSGYRGRYTVLPTKTSLRLIQFGGMSPSFLSACSQVFITSVVKLFSLLIFDAVILSTVSRSLIACIHFRFILFSVCRLPCMTLSHLSVQMRYADSDMMICRRRVGPLSAWFPCCPGASLGPLSDLSDILPQPRMVPMSIAGQGMLLWGHIVLLKLI